MTKLLVRIFLLFIFISSYLTAQESFNKEKLDQYLDLLEKNNKVMGAVTIYKDGKKVYGGFAGYASFDDGIKNGDKTKFRIGSISKTFTTVLVFQLIEQGKVKLEDKLSKFYPQIKNADKITISQMLWHRSGIHSFTDESDYLSYNTKPKTKDELVKLIAGFNPDFEPDTKTAYSNSNFVLLGFIVEDITGNKYKDVVQSKIVEKLNLEDTYYGDKISLDNNEANSYTYGNGSWRKESETDMSIPHGAGAMVSTPSDLSLFITALFNGKLISEESLEQMKEIKNNFGRGLFLMPFYGRESFGHTGGIDGFTSMLSYFPKEKVVYAYTGNGINYNMNELAIGVLSIYFNREFELPKFDAEVVLDAAQLDKYIGVYSSSALPLKLTLSVKEGQLFGQGTGQPEFPLTSTSEDEFRFDQAGVVIKFESNGEKGIEYKKFHLHQGGGKYLFERE